MLDAMARPTQAPQKATAHQEFSQVCSRPDDIFNGSDWMRMVWLRVCRMADFHDYDRFRHAPWRVPRAVHESSRKASIPSIPCGIGPGIGIMQMAR